MLFNKLCCNHRHLKIIAGFKNIKTIVASMLESELM